MSQSHKSAFEADPLTGPKPESPSEPPLAVAPHERASRAGIRRSFWLSLAVSALLAAFNGEVQGAVGATGPRFAGGALVPTLLGLVVLATGGRVLLFGAVAEARAKVPGMMMLGSAGVGVAGVYNLAVSIGLPGQESWWQVTALVALLLFARQVESAVIARATRAHPLADPALPESVNPGDGLQSSTSPSQELAARASIVLVFVTVGTALFAGAWWLALDPGDAEFAVQRTVAVLVIGSPLAVRLAIPLVVWVATAIGLRSGLLVRSRVALDEARRTQVVLFDKTGTLTEGELAVTDIRTAPGLTADEVLRLAAAVERRSTHPIARAIETEAAARKLRRGRPSRFSALAGRGAQATIDHRAVTVASARVAIERGLIIDAAFVRAAHTEELAGKSVVYVLTDTEVLGMIALLDTVRPGSDVAVERLRRRGVRSALLTGDSREAAKWIGARLGITEVFAEVLPDQKRQVVEGLQRDGALVAMVGSAIDDAGPLQQADVGIAIDGAVDVAADTAGIVLASADPRGAYGVIELSRSAHRVMLQNVFWALGYNAAAITLFAFGAVVASPLLAAALALACTLVVAANAQRLNRLDLGA